MDTSNSVDQKGGNGKMAWIVAGIVLIGVIVALNNVSDKEGKKEVVEGDDLASSSLIVDEVVAGEVAVVTDADLALPYTVAMQKYAGVRMALDSRCVASPATLDLEKGTKVMFDNRGSSMVRVTVAGMAYDIGAYNFTFVTLDAEKLPAIFAVSCGDVAKAATITVTQ